MTAAAPISKTDRVAWAILAIAAAYGLSFFGGWPQQWTAAASTSASHSALTLADGEGSAEPVGKVEGAGPPPPAWTVVPFVLLLGAIAVFPLIPATEHWWESNLHRFYVAAGLGLVTLAYYAFLHREAIELHWPGHRVVLLQDGVQVDFFKTVLTNALLAEYIPFIVLLFSLYTITGGIRIEGDLRADPMTNATFMAIGGLLASLIGTTGAAMLLIRPLLETNRERKHVAHTVIFFIFVVCNCGGCLLPIGDPPLFLGYLQGRAFPLDAGAVEEWLFVNGCCWRSISLSTSSYFYRTRDEARH